MTDNLEKIKAAQEWHKLCVGNVAYLEDKDRTCCDTIRQALEFQARYLKLAETHKLVPIEPTYRQAVAGWNGVIDSAWCDKDAPNGFYDRIYKAMISAAPDIMKGEG